MEKGRLEGLEVDPQSEEVRWGSVYWAKVARVDASLDAVFVNLDGDNIGILHNADVRVRQKDGSWKKGGDIAIGKALKPGQMIAVQAKSGYLPKNPDEHSRAEDKNPRLSMNITMPGRYLIYAPMDQEARVSQRIRNKKLRAQLMTMLEGMSGCEGCILRASAAGTQTDMLSREAKILQKMWGQIQAHFKGDEPSLIMLGPDAIQRSLSDQAARQIGHIELTVMDHFKLAEEWCDIFAPDLVTKIRPVEVPNADKGFALFEFHDIINDIESLFQPYGILTHGSTIIIQETAAATVIDVNSAADGRGKLAINLDAAKEIARHLRLRNLGGAIIVDFLKMNSREDEKKLLKALEEAFNQDPCTVQLHGFTKLGMVEATRQRRTPPLRERYDSAVGTQ
jgi:ribonuclease G